MGCALERRAVPSKAGRGWFARLLIESLECAEFMLAFVTWVCYAGGLYVAWAIGFRAQYSRWPMAYSFPPKDLYSIIDFVLSMAMWGYFAWTIYFAFVAPDVNYTGPIRLVIDPFMQAAGLCFFGLGFFLRLWTLRVLGKHWRMGQDANDAEHRFVLAGPYVFMKHPINTACVIVALGQVLITGMKLPAAILLLVAVGYHMLQGKVEEAHWSRKHTLTPEPPK